MPIDLNAPKNDHYLLVQGAIVASLGRNIHVCTAEDLLDTFSSANPRARQRLAKATGATGFASSSRATIR